MYEDDLFLLPKKTRMPSSKRSRRSTDLIKSHDKISDMIQCVLEKPVWTLGSRKLSL